MGSTTALSCASLAASSAATMSCVQWPTNTGAGACLARMGWLFCPMGVADPGAMRQWGHHAIAFVGRRYFDQANLIESYFRRQSP